MLSKQARKLVTANTHRPPFTITQYADRIAVIKDGCFKETGTHEHLLQQSDSIYAGFYNTVQNDSKSSASDDIFVPPSMPRPPLHVFRPNGCADTLCSNMLEGSKTATSENNINNNYYLGCCSVENKATVYRLWNLNRPEMLYLIIGMVGGIITGLLTPAEGFFLAKITVSLISERFYHDMAEQF